MTKAETERIRKLEAQIESLRKLPKFSIGDWEKIWTKLNELGERLGLLEKAHNMTVEELYIWTDMRQDNKKRLRVEEKP